MPYRRLPNTDSARCKALKNAQQKGKEIPPFKLAFSQATFQKVLSFLPAYEKAIQQQKSSLDTQIERNQDFHRKLKKARLYLSHFIQVVNMAIQRGELPASIREHYQLDGYGKRLPRLTTEKDIIKWGEALIEGEANRIRKGKSPITNPTIAVVKVRYEKFLEAYRIQKNLQESNERDHKQLAELRPRADEIISCIWNEVEASFKDLPDHLRREKASDYGVVYVYRKNEPKDRSLFQAVKLGIS